MKKQIAICVSIVCFTGIQLLAQEESPYHFVAQDVPGKLVVAGPGKNGRELRWFNLNYSPRPQEMTSCQGLSVSPLSNPGRNSSNVDWDQSDQEVDSLQINVCSFRLRGPVTNIVLGMLRKLGDYSALDIENRECIATLSITGRPQFSEDPAMNDPTTQTLTIPKDRQKKNPRYDEVFVQDALESSECSVVTQVPMIVQ